LTDPSNPHEPPSPPSFEQALVQLEHIVHQLEDGDVGLAEALSHYEQGVKLLKQCYGLLQRAERRIELLSGVDADGNPVAEPFDDEASLALEEQAQSRSRRRSKKPEPGNKRAVSAPPIDRADDENDVDTSGSLF
jgi:exodeoxyribonuclease VII small subunit